jgi:hypothetical protein
MVLLSASPQDQLVLGKQVLSTPELLMKWEMLLPHFFQISNGSKTRKSKELFTMSFIFRKISDKDKENPTNLSFLSVKHVGVYYTTQVAWQKPQRDWKHNMQLLLQLRITTLWNNDNRTHHFSEILNKMYTQMTKNNSVPVMQTPSVRTLVAKNYPTPKNFMM